MTATLDRTSQLRGLPGGGFAPINLVDSGQQPSAGEPVARPPAPPTFPAPARVPSVPRIGGDLAPSKEQIERLTQLLAVHVGQLVRIIIARRSGEARTIGQLIALLESEIPNPAERSIFRQGAASIGTWRST